MSFALMAPRWSPFFVGSAVLILSCANEGAAEPVSELTIQAAAGEPFGVAKITFPADQKTSDRSPWDGEFQISQKDGRVLYPTFVDATAHRWRYAAEERSKEAQTVYFLFRGSEPFSITVHAPTKYEATITPTQGKEAHWNFVNEWWTVFMDRRSLAYGEEADVSPVIDNYLAAMLARRMDLKYERSKSWLSGNDHLDQVFGLLLGTESIRAAMQNETMLNTREGVEVADRPLPLGVAPPALELLRAPADVQIEPMALHVPHECLYLRFGSFENFQWFREAMDDWGGSMRNITAVRGFDYEVSARIERQLGLKETPLSKIFGPQVIADVAIIGQDTFVREGTSLGFVFQAKNSLLLNSSITQQRAAALQNGAKETKERIADHDVSLIATDDNRVRSFYAVDGDYHLVTNSRTLVRRFYEAGQGQQSLGKADEFRSVRTLMPLSRDDSAFVYLSDEFFRNLVGPKYRVEMTRRMQALTEIELIQLAKLAARAEGVPGDRIEQLLAAQLLPKLFGQRSDGSHPSATTGGYVDSLRGARGSFLPVADVEVEKVTRAEADAYEEFSRFYRGQWQRVDPVAIGIKHQAGGKANRERIVCDIHIAPYAKTHYGEFAAWFSPATKSAVGPVPGDIFALQTRLRFWGKAETDEASNLVFGGIRDFGPPFVVRNGYAFPESEGETIKKAPFYLGGSPKGGFIELFTGTNTKPELDADGYGENLNGSFVPYESWLRIMPDFKVLSPQRKTLEVVTPQLKRIEAARSAQIRLHVGDLSQAKLGAMVGANAFLRGQRTSMGNTRLLHHLAQQFQVPRDDCLKITQNLLDAKLICTLGGTYQMQAAENGLQKWISTAWKQVEEGKTLSLPAGYQPPPLNWFRGLDLEFSIGETALDVYVELDVERKTR